MSLKDEVRQIMAEHLAQYPTWSRLGEDPPVINIPVSGTVEDTLQTLSWKVVIFFPWDPEQRLFRGEKVYTAGLPLPTP